MVQRYGKQAVIALAVTLAIWSTTFAGLRAALQHYPPAHLVFVRWTAAALVLVAYGAFTGMRLPRREDLPSLALAGFTGFTVYQVALAFGQAGLSAGVAGFLINLGPAFTTLMAVALGYERASKRLWAGLAISMVGVGLLAAGKGVSGGINVNALFVVLAAASFGVYVIVSKPLLARYTSLEVTTYAIVAGSLPFVVLAPGVGSTLAAAPLSAHLTVAYLVLFPAALAYVTWSKVLASFGPGVGSRFLYLVPVLSLGVAWVWLGEVPTPISLIAGFVVLGGVILAASKPKDGAESARQRRLGRLAAAVLDTLKP